MTDTCSAISTVKKAIGRSRVSSGRDVLPGVDGRTAPARRFGDVLDRLIVEFDARSESDLLLCREAARLQVEQEQRAAAHVRGEAVDERAGVTAGNSLRRILRDLTASYKARKRAQRKNLHD
jgi:hypothetical protein